METDVGVTSHVQTIHPVTVMRSELGGQSRGREGQPLLLAEEKEEPIAASVLGLPLYRP